MVGELVGERYGETVRVVICVHECFELCHVEIVLNIDAG